MNEGFFALIAPVGENRNYCLQNNYKILFQSDCDTTLPVNYGFGRREGKFYLKKVSNLTCTKCQRKSEEFEDTAGFHEHILKCLLTEENRENNDDHRLENGDSTDNNDDNDVA